MEPKGKDSIMKMLLSSPNQTAPGRNMTKSERAKILGVKDEDIGSSKLSKKLQQLSGQGDGIVSTVDLDHNYSRPWNWRPENSYTKPVKTLFVQRTNNLVSPNSDGIDADKCGSSPLPVYDSNKARQLMEECEKHIGLIRNHRGDPDWETNVDRSEWSVVQTRLFERVCKLLSYERLSRLSLVNTWNEPVLRRIAVNKTANRFRSMLASVSWDPHLIQWLHNLLMEILDITNLIAYIDILQTLKSKVPVLMDRMLVNHGSNKSSTDTLNLLLQRPWDPSAFGMTCYNPKMLPGNPLLLMVPNNPFEVVPNSRPAKWQSYLSQLGTVISVNTPLSPGANKVSMLACLEQMMAATRAKLSEIRSDYIGRNIILVGWNSGAALACQVALLEPVTAVVCLGFPLNTAEDKRGQPDDHILNISSPVLFVIGQHAATTFVDDIEDLRERLHVETGLVVVGAADDQLRITKSKQGAEGITQSMVDRCIVDEIGDFIGTILSNPFPSSRNDIRPRIKLIEKKRRISVQDDIYNKKRDPQSSAPYVRKGRTNTRGGGAGRSKWTAQVHRSIDATTTYKQDTSGTLASIRRTPVTGDKLGRPSIDNISVVNSTSNDGNSVDPSTANLLPQIKVLRSEECGLGVGSNTSLVDQLTPDSLLEMPVIIAQEDSQDLPLKY